MKYSIDYYQREYRWESKQIRELLDDLSGVFLKEYEPGIERGQVKNFPHYFLGSIIISQKGNEGFIVDGQQRLTSLTLLLLLLRNLQQGRPDAVNVDALILSEHYGKKDFNLDVDERRHCMEALYNGHFFDASDQSESVQNLYEQYTEMESDFPDELRDQTLPYFADWLIDNVHLVEIAAYTDEDAYTIFETMNDRGISLTPTEMLKGYLLANMEPHLREEANGLWRTRIQNLVNHDDGHGADFFKTWLRSQYAEKIRERRKGARPEDFDRIGTEFHRWLGEARDSVGLNRREDFFRFVERDFDFYSNQFLLLRKCQGELTPGLEHIFYNAELRFTLQDMLLLAPLCPEDFENTIRGKLSLVAQFVDILLTWRIWNSRSTAYSTMQYAMFLVMREIRRLDPGILAERLYQILRREKEAFGSNPRLGVHQQNRFALHRILARMNNYVEVQSGLQSRYLEYVAPGRDRYEVEHIWANRFERHHDEFNNEYDFREQRSRIGGLLLLPKLFNASYGDMSYGEKLPHYNTQNLLARSLHPLAYEHNPGFLKFVHESGLPFHPHEQFKRADLEERGELYRLLVERIWNPDDLLHGMSES